MTIGPLIEPELRRWAKSAPSYKMSDGGVDYRDISEGPMHEVKLHQGSPCGPRSASSTVAPRRQGSILMSRTCDYGGPTPPESFTLPHWDWAFLILVARMDFGG
jgi:hypothetical protein